MKIKFKILIESENFKSEVEEIYDDEEDFYEPEIIAGVVSRAMLGFGYNSDLAKDIQALGWERLEREKPYENGTYLVSYTDDENKYCKTDIDDWIGDSFKKYGNRVVFWTLLPSSPAFWAKGG